MNSWLDRIVIVLCRPEGALNVGAVCRGMKSMGIHRLSLAAPLPLDREEVYQMAVHAKDIYQEARVYPDLPSALKGTVLAAGTTRRRGNRRKFFSLLPEEFAQKAASLTQGDTALVFGNEQTGLTREELGHCNVAVHIPSSPKFPSLNLSHAVQIMTYTLWREAQGSRTGGYTPIDREARDQLVQGIHQTLDAAGYFDKADRFQTDYYFRDILARAALSPREGAHLLKVFHKLRYLKNDSPGEES